MNTAVPPGTRPALPGDPAAIGPYPVVGRLGAGGMGVVYLARSPSGDLVAVKTLRPAVADDPEARSRFQAEVLYGRRATSVWTPTVLADGTDTDSPYIVTEYIRGPSLSEWVLTQGPLTGGVLSAIAIGTAAALVTIHRAGLLHRDLKPANVLLSPEGPRLIDFGIASGLEVAGGLTQQGMVMGSPGWVSPERLTGGPATEASDVFGWGCVVAFAGLGRHPYHTGQASEILEGHPEVTGLEEPLRGLVLLALSRDPAARPAATVLLDRLLEMPVPATYGMVPLDDLLDAGPEAAATPTGAAAQAVASLWTFMPEAVAEPPAGVPLRRRRYRVASLTAAGVLGAGVATLALASPHQGSLTQGPAVATPSSAKPSHTRLRAPAPSKRPAAVVTPKPGRTPSPSPTAGPTSAPPGTSPPSARPPAPTPTVTSTTTVTASPTKSTGKGHKGHKPGH